MLLGAMNCYGVSFERIVTPKEHQSLGPKKSKIKKKIVLFTLIIPFPIRK